MFKQAATPRIREILGVVHPALEQLDSERIKAAWEQKLILSKE